MNKSFYSFVTLRYVHDAIAGESLNVGLVAYWPEQRDLRVRVRGSMGRVRGMFPDVDRRAFLTSLRAIRRALVAEAKTASSHGLLSADGDALRYACSSLARDDSAFQWSEVGRGVSGDAETEFESLYQRLVGRYDVGTRSNRSDEAVWRPVRDSLLARKIDIDFEEKSLAGETDTVTFENAWKNGRWHAYQAVSLDLSTPDNILDKARRWRGQMTGVAEGSRSDSEPIELSFLLGKPQDPSLGDAFLHALSIFKRMPLNPRIYSEDEAELLVDEIEKEYRQHSAG
jgi:hypothetical protein